MKYSVAVIYIVSAFYAVAKAEEGITCYRCTVLPQQYLGEPNQTCSQFDGSKRFYVQCPKSTLCMKRTSHFTLSNGTIVTTSERGCASQKYSFQEYNFDDRTWHSGEKVIETAYTEGCFMGENRGAPNGPSEYCYCSYHLCNGSSMKNSEFVMLLMTAAILLKLSL